MDRIDFSLEDKPHIELIRLIKYLGLVPSGAAASEAVVRGHVFRNGEVELRKRAKIIKGDVVIYSNWEIVVG